MVFSDEAGRVLLDEQGVREPVQDAVLATFDHALEAVDDAAQGGDRLADLDGVGPATIDELASLSPLTPPGEWTTEKLAAGHYRFTAGSATVQMAAGTGTAADVLVDHDGDEPLHLPAGFSLDNKTWSLTTGWWAIRRLMEWNPQGPGSDIPRNVPTPDDWRLWSNQSTTGYNSAAWRHEATGVNVAATQQAPRADGHADPDDDHLLYVEPQTVRDPSDRHQLATGTWAAVLEAAETALASAPDGSLDDIREVFA